MKPVPCRHRLVAKLLLASFFSFLPLTAHIPATHAETVAPPSDLDAVRKLVTAFATIGSSLAATGAFDSPSGERLTLMPFHRIAAHLAAIDGLTGKAREKAECEMPSIVHGAVFELDAVLSGYQLTRAVFLQLQELRSAESAFFSSAMPQDGAADGGTVTIATGETEKLQKLTAAFNDSFTKYSSDLISHKTQIGELVPEVSRFLRDPSWQTPAKRRSLAGTIEGLGYFIPASLRVEWIELRSALEPVLEVKTPRCEAAVRAMITAMREPLLALRGDLEKKASTHYPRVPLDQRSIGTGIRRAHGAAMRSPAQPESEEGPAGLEDEAGESEGDAGDV